MAANTKIKLQVVMLFITAIVVSCTNHIDKYSVQLDSLKKLPDNFYSNRDRRVYVEDLKAENFRIWFNLDCKGNVSSISNIEDFRYKNEQPEALISAQIIDTSAIKVNVQTFIELSKKYKFGHILINKANKISFSYRDGLPEEYVRTFNNSLRNLYLQNKDFKLLQNGWFENVSD